jgi:hypothetical protein
MKNYSNIGLEIIIVIISKLTYIRKCCSLNFILLISSEISLIRMLHILCCSMREMDIKMEIGTSIRRRTLKEIELVWMKF